MHKLQLALCGGGGGGILNIFNLFQCVHLSVPYVWDTRTGHLIGQRKHVTALPRALRVEKEDLQQP